MEQIFIKLLNLSISAGWFVIALMLLRPFLKKAPRYISCILWGLVGLRLCLPVSLPSVLSLIPSAQTVPPEILYSRAPQIDTGIPIINSSINPVILNTMTPEPLVSVNPIQIVMILAANIWILGMVIMALYAMISYTLLRHRLREAVNQSENIWVCDRVDSPFLLGLFRPRIYLPSTLSAENSAYVIAHEKAHLHRRDHWWKPLGFLILTVYWFNPLMWVAYIFLCRDIEYACDEKVLRSMGTEHKKAYSEALVSCSAPRKMITACPVAFGEDGVKGRIKSVLNYKKPAFWIILVAILASIAAAVCFLTDPAQEKPGGKEDLFGGVFETGVCNYSYVLTADKETETNQLVFRIDPEGNVYQDYGGGENEYIGMLQPSDFALDALNDHLYKQGGSPIYFDGTSACWELLDADGNRTHIFYPASKGHAGMISFFVNGSVMSWFTLNKTGVFTAPQTSLTYQFSATVISNRNGRLLVEPFADENEAKTADRFYVPLPSGNPEAFAEGDLVKIVYDGTIQELYPAIIPNAHSVTKLAEDIGRYTTTSFAYTTTYDIDSDGIPEDCHLHLENQPIPAAELMIFENNCLEYRFVISMYHSENMYFSLQNEELFLVEVLEDGSERSHSIKVKNNELVVLNMLTLQQNTAPLSSDTFTLASLREKYPQFFGLSTVKGLEVYVWNAGQYRCGVRSGTNREAALEELHAFGEGATLEEMSMILSYYGVSREEVAVLYSYDPAFSGPYPDVPKDQRAIEDALFHDTVVVTPEQSNGIVGDGVDLGFDPYQEYKLVIYAYQLGENAWRFQFLKNTKLGHTALSLMKIDSMSLETARQLLRSYDLAPEEIPVIVYCNPYSSYLADLSKTAVDTARKLLFLPE